MRKGSNIFLCRLHLVVFPIFLTLQNDCGNSSVGRAKASQALGRGFEPRFPLKGLITETFFVVMRCPINSEYSIDCTLPLQWNTKKADNLKLSAFIFLFGW